MGVISERLALLITANPDDAVRGLTKLERAADRSIGSTTSRVDELGYSLTKIGAGMLSVGVLGGVGLARAAQATSDLNEATSQTEQIFGAAADEVGDFAKTAASTFGQSERAARDATSEFGLLLKNMKFGQDETVQWSKDLTVLASDMASFKNTSPEEAVLALGAALRGESEPIRRYGVMLDDATVRQRAVEMGLAATTAAVDDHGKAQARLAIIMDSTTDIQGDFARTSDGLANSQRTLSAQFEEFQANIGQAVLPALEALTGAGNDVLGWFNELDPATQEAVASLVTYTTAGLAAGGGLALLTGKLVQARTAILSMTAAGRAATIGMGALGVVLVAIAAGYHLYGQAADEAAEREERWRRLANEKASAARNVAATLDDMTGALTNASKEMIATELAALGLADNFEAAGFSGERLWAVLDQTADVSDETRSEYKKLLAEIYAGSEITNEQEAALDDLLGGFTEGHRIWRESRDLIDGVSDATDDAADSITDLKQAYRDMLDELVGGFSAQIDADRLFRDLQESMDGVNDTDLLDAREAVEGYLLKYAEIAEQAATNGEAIPESAQAAADGFAPLLEAAGAAASEIREVETAVKGIEGLHATATINVNTTGMPLSYFTGRVSTGGTAPAPNPLAFVTPEFIASYGSGSGSGDTVNVTVEIDGDAIANAEINSGRRGGR